MKKTIRIVKDVNDRMGYLGGSSWGAALGVSTYKTPYDVYQDYIGNPREVAPETQEIFDMGHELEGFIADQAERIFGIRLRRSNFLYLCSDDRRLGCHPDRFVSGKPIGVEIKSSSAYDSGRWGAQDTDEIPYDYLLQCYSYMICCDSQEVWLFRFSNNRLTRYVIERPDQEKLDSIREMLSNLLDRFDRGEAPSPMDYDEASRIWGPKPGSIEADSDVASLVEQYKELNSEKSSIEKQMDGIKMELLKRMEDSNASSIYDAGTGKSLCSYSTVEKESFDSKRFLFDHPEYKDEYRKTTSYNQIRISTRR